ncbi:tail fiber protein [uncultured Aquimarina sp.]|uniref:tail fiber protein n=1 Tax=uncultured Aquimarina sp. TaxID=575652 RepID=UPI00262C5C84|nr:tail fiber protein [uncultured Aquimarina sp.]
MSKSLFFLCVLVSSISVLGQTNTFPSDGNVGIGTTIPQAKLEVLKAGTIGGAWNPSGSFLTLSDTGSSKMIMDSNEIYGSGTLYLGSTSGDIIKLRTVPDGGAIDRFVVKADGRTGIGTMNPKSLLELNASTSGDAVLRIEADTNNSNEANNARLELYQDGALHGAFLGFDDSWGGTAPDNLFRIVTRSGGVNNYNNFIINPSTSNIGIGISNPEETLHVKGTTTIDGDIGEITEGAHWHTGKHTLELQNRDAGDVVLSFHRAGYTNAAIKHPTTGGIAFSATGGFDQTHMYLKTNGYLGIGTTTPDAKLAVNGNIHTKEVKVDLIGWADYVFKEDYNLPTLQEVEDHITTKGHLINIPSAAEVAENGIHLGEMNAKLLEKIEELTLYTIEQEKKLYTQQKEIEVLKKQNTKINDLEQKLNTLLKTK